MPELAGFLLLSFLIQLPLLLFLLTDSQVIHLPLEVPMHSLFLAFLLFEIVAAFLALRTMTKQLAAQFYLRQFQEGERGRLELGGAQGDRQLRWGDAAGPLHSTQLVLAGSIKRCLNPQTLFWSLVEPPEQHAGTAQLIPALHQPTHPGKSGSDGSAPLKRSGSPQGCACPH